MWLVYKLFELGIHILMIMIQIYPVLCTMYKQNQVNIPIQITINEQKKESCKRENKLDY